MTDLVVFPSERPLTGSVPIPGDKSIAHRALLFAGLAEGQSRIVGGALGADNMSTLAALRAMGITTEEQTDALLVGGKGLYGLRAPSAPIDCGNSGTTMRLLAGVLVAQRFAAVLVGDESLSRRPMERVARPLRLRGGRIEGKLDPKRVGEITAPLQIGPLPEPNVLGPLEYEMPVASAQVKSAILLSGLYANGPTYVREPLVSRDHTERLMLALGVPLRSVGSIIELDGPSFSGKLPPFEITVPGDPSSASFLVTAAQLVPGSRVTVRRVGLNPTRTGLFEVLRDMGGALVLEPKGEEMGEPIGDLHAGAADLRPGRLGGELVARTIDEVPILCALAARAHGTTLIEDAAELRVKESDRIAMMARVLRAFGLDCEERPDGLAIEGKPEGKLKAADIESGGDHRIAMASCVLGLLADGPTRVRDADNIATSFPRFVGTMRALGARIEVEPGAGGTP
ncbi:3-phosphoshikimate 1-carboxyvinyltransferase [Polyangium spumosum]|uniref:3-phosphoshikimate 1-carboxyvinyltransferase n=1 Tax=Polyangium spumosum TaxID=889282 RepID=A0A6N7PUH0_9BACT|nr:3-phosphoshikimate 1-carboxyvinyltransferase [Polyangium spumosum]